MSESLSDLSRRSLVILAITVTMLSVAGCHLGRNKPPVPAAHTVYRSPNLTTGSIRRVLLMPVANQTRYIVAGDRFYDLLASEITSIRCFDAVRVSPYEAHMILPDTDVRNGRYSEKMLVKLRDIYNVDAIMFASLKDFQPYWPQRFSASMQLVSTSTGETVWSIDGVWDGRDENVSRMAQQSFTHSTAGRMSGDSELVLQSPEYMGKFVACQMASSLKKSWPPFEYALPDPSKGVTLTSHAQEIKASSTPGDADTSGETIGTPLPSSDQPLADSELPQPSPPAN